MKILVIQKENIAGQQLLSKLTQLGYAFEACGSVDEAKTLVAQDHFGIVIYDPGPQNIIRQIVFDIRRASRGYSYILLHTDAIEALDALKTGANDVLPKPCGTETLSEALSSATHTVKLVQHVADTSQDFPSEGGVISKSAFNQLFLSVFDRAVRHGDTTPILFISIDNLKEIRMTHDDYSVKKASAKLAQHLVSIRRSTDILAQIDDATFALLMFDMSKSAQPEEAAKRFAESMASLTDFLEQGATKAVFKVELLRFPTGKADITLSFTSS